MGQSAGAAVGNRAACGHQVDVGQRLGGGLRRGGGQQEKGRGEEPDAPDDLPCHGRGLYCTEPEASPGPCASESHRSSSAAASSGVVP